MSQESNTNLIEEAIELASQTDDSFIIDTVNLMVLTNDLEELASTVHELRLMCEVEGWR